MQLQEEDRTLLEEDPTLLEDNWNGRRQLEWTSSIGRDVIDWNERRQLEGTSIGRYVVDAAVVVDCSDRCCCCGLFQSMTLLSIVPINDVVIVIQSKKITKVVLVF